MKKNLYMKKNLLIAATLAAVITPTAFSRTTIRVLYATTPGVRSSHGGTSNSRSLVNSKHSELRSIDGNSQLDINWTRPTAFSSSYNTSNVTSSLQLDRLEGSSQLSDVRNRRNQTNGDLVHLFCQWSNTSTLGTANLPGAFSITLNRTLNVLSGSGGQRIVTYHEIGHNMNGTHDRAYCFSQGRETLMANRSRCSGSDNFRLVYSSSTLRANRNGTRGPRIGNGTHNNRGRIRGRRSTTSNFR